MSEAITLLDLNRRLGSIIASEPGLNDVWVTGETSDLRTSGAHCYLELIQKDDKGAPLARARAVIWSSTYGRVAAKFSAATGTQLRSDMKIMVRVSVSYHPVYGLSLVIGDINPDYTVGDLARKRMEIIARLKDEGVYDLNRTLAWSPTPWRVAVVSARNAAGYGDFVRHLHCNPHRLRFSTTLFEAALQGERTAPSIIGALEQIMERVDEFDCVVIIRGGGAVADLASFDNYELAANVSQFPLPVIVGIGHDRDVTVLDYVANTRVKTPTAAAEALIGRMADAYGRVRTVADSILAAVRNAVAANSSRLSYYRGLLPALASNAISLQRRAVGPESARAIAIAARTVAERQKMRLDALGDILEAISPEATLRRGYSITRLDGHAVTDSATLSPGSTITTVFASGEPVESVVK